MTGYVYILGPCYTCRRLFHFHPHRVPSYDPSLDDPSKPAGRQPICSTCIVVINERRKAAGLDEWPVYPDSYEPVLESEVALGE